MEEEKESLVVSSHPYSQRAPRQLVKSIIESKQASQPTGVGSEVSMMSEQELETMALIIRIDRR